MKMILLIVMMVLGSLHAEDQNFTSSIRLYKPIAITSTRDLIFPERAITGSNFNITIDANSPNAASFNTVGGKDRSIIRTVVEPSVRLSSSGNGGAITVGDFTLSGPTAFNEQGEANGINVGATAKITAANRSGDYVGTATFRVVYM
ncbi:MAG: DUF4402 domain-containing protein [Pseudomonadota bacterium]